MADLVKGIILEAEGAPNERRLEALRVVSRFERCGWHPGMMAEALESTAGAVSLGGTTLTVAGEPEEMLDALEVMMNRYLDLHGFDPTPNLYTMAEAAEYLGISPSMMETYVTRRGEIKGTKIGRSWVFTREALDHFQETQRRSPGRPPAEAD